jgi:membrane protease YdiL (CAAX protease family)
MISLIKLYFKIIVALVLGLFLMTLRPTLAMILEKARPSTFANYYFRESLSFGIALIVLIIAIIIAGRGKYDTFGFSKPRHIRPILPLTIAALAGAGSTALGSLFKLKSPEIMGEMSFPQIVVSIWLIASIYEELVVRGFIQGTLDIIFHRMSDFRLFRLSFPVIISGMFFGLSHLMLLSVGATAGFVILVVIFALVVGLTAAYYKEKTGSLLPAILIHMIANIAGTASGYIFK